jgi:hypothetical protein
MQPKQRDGGSSSASSSGSSRFSSVVAAVVGALALPDLVLVLGPACRFLLLAGYENLTAPLFA